MRNCPMCGTEIPEKKHACPNCGSDYPEGFFEPGYAEEAIVNNPSWGEISIDFSEFGGDGKKLIEEFAKFWSSNESNPATRLALFPGQFQKIPSDAANITLYAPSDLYRSIEGFFSEALMHGLILHCKRLSLDEIQNQQKLHAKFK